MRPLCLLTLVCIASTVASVPAADPDPKDLVQRVIQAAGGEDKLLKLFRIREKLNVSADPDKKPSERVSVLEPPDYWWLGKKDRGPEPAKLLVWAWTLGAFTDPKSTVEPIPDIEEGDRPAFGLRVSGTISPAMDVYFDREENRLVRIDWRADVHRFSDWREHDGVRYPAKCVGYKKASGRPWYFSEIVELERLSELPKGLER